MTVSAHPSITGLCFACLLCFLLQAGGDDVKDLPNFLTTPGWFRTRRKVFTDRVKCIASHHYYHRPSLSSAQDLSQFQLTLPSTTMTKCTVTLHPNGLNPSRSAKAWLLRKKSKLPWKEVRQQVRTVNGKVPDQRAVENAVQNVTSRKHGIPHMNCANCGRTPIAQHATPQKHMCRTTCAYEI